MTTTVTTATTPAASSSSSVTSGLGSFFANLGNNISSALSKAEQFGENFVKELEGEEVAIANDTVNVINTIEGGIAIANNIAAAVPVYGPEVQAILALAVTALNNAKALAIAIETGAAQAPGGESNV